MLGFQPSPTKLRINAEGEVVLADGSSAKEYLKACAQQMRATPDTPVCLMLSATADSYLKDAYTYRLLHDERFALAA